MSQRHSEYELVPGDCYFTPAWVTEALLSVEEFSDPIWEPAPGDGHMVRALTSGGYSVAPSHMDFLSTSHRNCNAKSIVTNPPYSQGLAEKFVRHAINLMLVGGDITDRSESGKVAMLLPHAWDTAKGRRDIFEEHPAFKAKHTLTRRIRWENLEQKANGPSSNHAWFVWDWKHSGPPTLGYLP